MSLCLCGEHLEKLQMTNGIQKFWLKCLQAKNASGRPAKRWEHPPFYWCLASGDATFREPSSRFDDPGSCFCSIPSERHPLYCCAQISPLSPNPAIPFYFWESMNCSPELFHQDPPPTLLLIGHIWARMPPIGLHWARGVRMLRLG